MIWVERNLAVLPVKGGSAGIPPTVARVIPVKIEIPHVVNESGAVGVLSIIWPLTHHRLGRGHSAGQH